MEQLSHGGRRNYRKEQIKIHQETEKKRTTDDR